MSNSYQVPEQDIANYYCTGYIIFRRILPIALLADLRREADKALLLARELSGPSAQRLQPVHEYEGKLNLQPFRDYTELPALREAIDQVFTKAHYIAGINHHLGILFNPAETPWSMPWHRDITTKNSRMEPEEFEAMMLDWDASNQINCPLYEDNCTWFVPGSHLRVKDLPGEIETENDPRKDQIGVKSTITNKTEKEMFCDAYVRSMPNAVQFHLGPGDMAIYRAFGWHTGNYVPHIKRATLHDTLATKRYAEWQKAWLVEGASNLKWRKP